MQLCNLLKLKQTFTKSHVGNLKNLKFLNICLSFSLRHHIKMNIPDVKLNFFLKYNKYLEYLPITDLSTKANLK